MPLLRHQRIVTIAKCRPDVEARSRVARDLEQHLVAEPQPRSRLHRRPVQPFNGDVLAERARNERMTLGLKLTDGLHREQTYRPVGTTVVLLISVAIPV